MMKILSPLLIASALLFSTPVFANDLNSKIVNHIAATSHYWNDKDGRAHRFLSSDANYRMYKPTISSDSNTVTVKFTLNHLRGSASDDQMEVTLVFNRQSKALTSQKVRVKWGDERWQEFTKNLAEVAAESSNAKVAAAGQLIALAGDIYLSIVGIEHGGRENFASVFHHQSALISDAVFKALS